MSRADGRRQLKPRRNSYARGASGLIDSPPCFERSNEMDSGIARGIELFPQKGKAISAAARALWCIFASPSAVLPYRQC